MCAVTLLAGCGGSGWSTSEAGAPVIRGDVICRGWESQGLQGVVEPIKDDPLVVAQPCVTVPPQSDVFVAPTAKNSCPGLGDRGTGQAGEHKPQVRHFYFR